MVTVWIAHPLHFLLHCSTFSSWSTGILLSPAVTHNDDRMACSDKTGVTSNLRSVDLFILPDMAGLPSINQPPRWVITVVWGGLWRDMRRDSFLSLIPKRHSFSSHMLAPSTYFWYNTAPTWIKLKKHPNKWTCPTFAFCWWGVY